MKALAWAVVAVGSGWLSATNLLQRRTHERITHTGVVVVVVMALLCLSAVIRVGDALGWWSLFYTT